LFIFLSYVSLLVIHFIYFSDLCVATKRARLSASDVLTLIKAALELGTEDQFGVIITCTGTSDVFYGAMFPEDSTDFLLPEEIHRLRQEFLQELATLGDCVVAEIGPGFCPYEPS
jgi:hypothetical protein